MSLDHNRWSNIARGAEQNVVRRPLGSVLVSTAYSQVVIPVFQRQYCWADSQLKNWFTNVEQGAELQRGGESIDIIEELDGITEVNSDNFHSVGIGRFKLTGNDQLVCVDGQQRLTTNSVLLAALRDATLGIKTNDQTTTEKKDRLVKTVESFVFNNADGVRLLGNDPSILRDSSALQGMVRLLPSQPDRAAYFSVLLNIPLTPSPEDTQEEESYIIHTKEYFDACLQEFLSDKSHQLDWLWRLLRSSLVWMRMMKIEVRSELNLGQWFLQLQEKSLLGFARLLVNDTPGIGFGATDLVKNLLLSVFLERPLKVQEEILSTKWAEPIQKPLYRDLDSFITYFLEENDFTDLRIKSDGSTERHVSAYERMMFTVTGGDKGENDSDKGEPEDSEDEEANTGEDKCAGLYLYARFNSYYDSLLVEGSDLEDIHFKILENLGLFVDPFLSRNKHL